jgi:hypothetical protein
MTKEEILSMAREAGVLGGYEGEPEHLERFAALVAEHEREECIDLVAFHGGPVQLEAAIRARSEA